MAEPSPAPSSKTPVATWIALGVSVATALATFIGVIPSIRTMNGNVNQINASVKNRKTTTQAEQAALNTGKANLEGFSSN